MSRCCSPAQGGGRTAAQSALVPLHHCPFLCTRCPLEHHGIVADHNIASCISPPLFQVVKRLVEDASVALASTRADAAARAEAEVKAKTEWEEKQAELKAAAEAKQLEEVKARAAFVLNELQPAVAPPEAIQAVREELIANAQAELDAAYEAAKLAASEAAREAAETKLADQQARLEELRAQKAEEAAAAAEEAGEEEPAELPEVTLDEPMVDVEAEVEKAVEAVVKPEPKEITDGDVLSAMLDKGVITKDGIVQAMAIHSLGDKAYVQDPLFAPPPQ